MFLHGPQRFVRPSPHQFPYVRHRVGIGIVKSFGARFPSSDRGWRDSHPPQERALPRRVERHFASPMRRQVLSERSPRRVAYRCIGCHLMSRLLLNKCPEFRTNAIVLTKSGGTGSRVGSRMNIRRMLLTHLLSSVSPAVARAIRKLSGIAAFSATPQAVNVVPSAGKAN